jgi:hypothetical protein
MQCKSNLKKKKKKKKTNEKRIYSGIISSHTVSVPSAPVRWNTPATLTQRAFEVLS